MENQSLISLWSSIQILTATIYFPEAKPKENRTLQGSPRETSFTVPCVKTQYLLYNKLIYSAQCIKRPATIHDFH